MEKFRRVELHNNRYLHIMDIDSILERTYMSSVEELYKKGITSFIHKSVFIDTRKSYDIYKDFVSIDEFLHLLRQDVSQSRHEFQYNKLEQP